MSNLYSAETGFTSLSVDLSTALGSGDSHLSASHVNSKSKHTIVRQRSPPSNHHDQSVRSYYQLTSGFDELPSWQCG